MFYMHLFRLKPVKGIVIAMFDTNAGWVRQREHRRLMRQETQPEEFADKFLFKKI